MWRYWLGIVAAVLLITESAFAQSRMALVIGNSNYQAAVSLANPANDSKAVAEAFTRAGFEVTRLSDLTQMEMRRAVRDFSARVAEKGSDTTALVFYAGHGVQVDGENFLIPIDARIQRESDVAIEALRLADIVKALETVQSRARIVMLDACRNNPFSTVGASGRGLAIVDAPAGSIVAYSTAPGTEAEDGTGQNSPYTSALLKVIPEPGLPIEQALKRVRLLVHESTEGRQTPWESSSLISDFEFYPDGATTSASPPLPQVAQRDAQSRDVQTRDAKPRDTHSRDGQARDGESRTTPRSLAWREQIRSRPQPRQAYDIVVMEDSVDAYEEFLLVYPYDPLAERIRYLLSLRAQALAWRYAVLANTPDSYSYYLNSYPGGDYARQAMRLREQPRIRPMDSVIAPRVIEPPRQLRVSLPSSQGRDSKGGSSPSGGKQGMPPGGSATTGLPPKTDQKTGDKTDQKKTDQKIGERTDQKKIDQKTGDKTDQKMGDKTDQKTGDKIDPKSRQKIDRKIAEKTDHKIERSARKSGAATTTGVKTMQKFSNSQSENRRNAFAGGGMHSGPKATAGREFRSSASSFSRSMSNSSFRASSGGGGGGSGGGHGGGGGGGGGGGRR
jgi:uncharacterized caspase-like protein